MTPEVKPPLLTEIINNTGIVTLNRPKELNAISGAVVASFQHTLQQWDGKVQRVILRGNGGKAFCVGGDVKTESLTSQENIEEAKQSMRIGYNLVYTIARYSAPCVVLMDGITMGTGVGISVHCRYRIVTERTMLAMPETTIGLYPDVSGTYFLSRLPGKLGFYLGLTGHRLFGKDVVKVGLGTHFVESKNIPKLFNALLNINNNGDVDSVVGRFSEDISSHKFSLDHKMDVINEAFSANTVEEILKRLQTEGSEFSLSTVKHLRKMSPIALKVTRLAIERGASMSLYECLQMEYRLGIGFFDGVSSRDVYEGIRALLVDKDNKPKWNPPTIEDVTDEMVERLFRKNSTEKEFLSKL